MSSPHTRHVHRSHSGRSNRTRWERNAGRLLLFASRAALLLVMGGLLLFHGGRDAEGWGLAGLGIALALVCWVGGCCFSGKAALTPTQGPLVFGLVLGLGLLQLSPWIGATWAPEGTRGFWEALQLAGLPAGDPMLSLLPGFHRQALLVLLAAVVFHFLLVQLFVGPAGVLGLASAIVGCSAVMSLLGLVQHFGGQDWLLWIYKGQTSVVSGTFLNRNHFAMLQEFGFFTGLGCACALFTARKGSSLGRLLGTGRIPLLVGILIGCVCCLVGLFFSYSRAGILCSLAGVLGFTLYAFWRLRDTKSSFLSLAVVLAAIGLVSFYGLDTLLSRLELALSGEDPSGLIRWEIWKTSFPVMGLSPFLGVGFGAFRYLSPMFEPSYSGGTISFNVHNDFLELAVALGIPCAVLTLGWLAFLFWRNARRVAAEPRSSLHFIGIGTMTALLVSAGHEVFDYGLQQPGNLLVWLAVIVAFSQTARWARTRTLPPVWALGRPLYALGGLLCLPALAMGQVYQASYETGMALNRLQELRELPEMTMAFSPAERQETILRQGELILARDGTSLYALDDLADASRQMAFIRQSALLAGKLSESHRWTVSPARAWSAVYAQELPAVFHSMDPEERQSIASWYRKAAGYYLQMLPAAPTNALIWAKLAQSLDDAASWEGQRGTATPLYDRACALYPRNGEVSGLAAAGYWRQYQEEQLQGRDGEEAFELLVAYARRTGEESPASVGKTLAFLWNVRPDVDLLKQVAPDTLQGQEQLYLVLRSHQQWAGALAALKQMDRLNEARPDEESPETLGVLAFLRRDRRDKALLRRIVAERKAGAYAALGDTAAAETQQAVVQQLLYAERTPELAEIDRLMKQGEYLIVEERLKKLPDDPRALVRYAEILWNAQRYELLARKLADFGKCQALADAETLERMEGMRLRLEEYDRAMAQHKKGEGSVE